MIDNPGVDRRISTPEIYYDQLDDPQTTDIGVAMRGLIKILNPPHPDTRTADWYDISRAMIEGSSTVLDKERSLMDISARIVGLMRQYPWLQGFMRHEPQGAPISIRDLDQWAGNHVFDDYPGLFGITQTESHIFRGAYHGGNQPDLVAEAVRKLDIADSHLE